MFTLSPAADQCSLWHSSLKGSQDLQRIGCYQSIDMRIKSINKSPPPSTHVHNYLLHWPPDAYRFSVFVSTPSLSFSLYLSLSLSLSLSLCLLISLPISSYISLSFDQNSNSSVFSYSFSLSLFLLFSLAISYPVCRSLLYNSPFIPGPR